VHQAQRLEALGALAGGVAHDFNNILAIINGFAHAGLQDAIPDSPLREDLRNILTAVNRGKELTRRILSFSRRANNQLRPLDLGATVFEGLKLVRAAIPDQIAIRQRRGNSPKIILGDETEWHQVITNLCVNSAQAIGQNAGEIEIDLRSDRELECERDFGLAVPYLELAVHDTGPGISPSDLPHIFDPFYTTKGCSEGTGLGLTIVHAIVAKSGGRVRAENRNAGGATIRILVPALPADRSTD
jgi:signal transduction histidine kinase